MTKRFYKTVTVHPDADGHAIRLDDRPLPTTTRRNLVLPTPDLAEAIAEEWRAQGDKVDPLSMPLTRLANTGIDRVAGERDRYVAELVRYTDTDTLAYWAPDPAELVARQRAEWQPLLDWFAEHVGHPMQTTSGISAVSQRPEVAAVLSARLAARSDLALGALQTLVAVSGSAVVTLALDAGRLDPEAAFRAAFLDELYQAEVWGTDREAEQRRRAIAEDMAQTARFLLLLDGR
ncbi:ATP12 family chaperone protein [Marinibaculum pumilum]|uniref:ATP12 family chaperone protein n=1 Tax=Marinibaculum pumilum TaxID=1766165 RepID=A0ABV7KYZ1_9PROT